MGKRKYGKIKAKSKEKSSGKAIKKVEHELLNKHIICKSVKNLNMIFPERFCTSFKWSQQLQYSGAVTKAWGVGGNFLHASSTNTISGPNYFPNNAFNQTLAMQGINLLIGNPNNNVGPYNSYRVNRSAVSLQCTTYATTTYPQVAPCYVAILPLTLAAIGTDSLGYVNSWNAPMFREYNYIRMKQLAFGMNKGVKISHAMSTAEMFGLKYKAALEDTQYSAQYGSNPVYNWGWIFAVFNDTADDSYQIEILETVTYEVEFFNRNVLAAGVV